MGSFGGHGVSSRPALALVVAVSAPPLPAGEAAEVAGVSERTIRRAIARGELPAGKHAGAYRIAPGDLATWQAAHAGAPDTGQPPQRTADTITPAARPRPDTAHRTDRQPRADRPARADTGQAGSAGADLPPWRR
ncbi:MAG: helix-turn-helix domain-containing protein [Chloroflexota bacterium]|nr:helix-turn-helix domain-containing protein [Chloroflexota bacterium]